MRILDKVPDSVLWLIAESDTVKSNLRQAARGLGIDPARLVFAVRKPRVDHLARLPLADLFLDTHYVSGHTTANDALRMGLPVLACPRDTFVSRVSASLLNALGLPELICPDLDSYRRTGVLLAHKTDRLAALRQKLRRQASVSPVFDTGRMVRDLESAYREICRRVRLGNAPEHVALPGADASAS
jgi:predicted O-linked N-acetylglucosamine transferase (SPINDLY family)